MSSVNNRSRSVKSGRGLVSSIANLPKKAINAAGDVAGSVLNKAIDILPIELHIPGYQYCGPGTKLEKRLKRGDPGINPLDKACKKHDIAYNTYRDTERRAQADKELAESAWNRVTSSDASVAEKAAAWAVTNIMKAKSKFGGRLKKSTRKRQAKRKGRGLYLQPYRPKSGCGYKGGRIKKKTRRGRRRRRNHAN